MQVTARLNNLKIAPRKVRLVAHVITGMSVEAALTELSKQVKRSSEPISKLLRSAVANAEHNHGIDPSNLFVRSVLVGDGARLKRWQPRAFGRANQILHRLSNVTLVVEERIEGLNRREVGMAKAAKKPSVKREKAVKEVKEEVAKAAVAADELKESKKESSVKQEMKGRKNAVKRVYQRKSV
ncbi:MAG: 50S ribosomal protein L22 [Candidatus Moranbacteria bacterium]|nr:50S ribosomal protein L22 [Candidatus Moranbacteria bacterium]NTW46165.1 50S ribosomal protein L22 [Candidatus Moranbacteria bacterium]